MANNTNTNTNTNTNANNSNSNSKTKPIQPTQVELSDAEKRAERLLDELRDAARNSVSGGIATTFQIKKDIPTIYASCVLLVSNTGILYVGGLLKKEYRRVFGNTVFCVGVLNNDFSITWDEDIPELLECITSIEASVTNRCSATLQWANGRLIPIVSDERFIATVTKRIAGDEVLPSKILTTVANRLMS